MTLKSASETDPVWPVVIIGTGFAGLGTAIELRRAGIGPFVLLERATEIGGTWRDNHYPGCACDVPSPLYSFSFAPNPEWTRLYARHDEIQRYLLDVVKTHDLRKDIVLGQEVRSSRYDENAKLWRITTQTGREYRARVLISGMGALSNPIYPKLEGIDRFEGESFHSAAWNHDYDLAGKRVAVIGTGASAIQFVPEIAPVVEQLHLYQRTPPWIVPRPDRAIGPRERALYRRVPAAQLALRGWIYCKQEARALAFKSPRLLMKVAERMARAHLERQVDDPVLRDKLTPSYTIGCKRILLSNDYYPALARANVQVLTDPIAEVTRTGIRTQDGTLRAVDAIVYGTGFRTQPYVAPGAVIGRDGLDLNAIWRDHMAAYKGTCVAGFPNLFILAGPNTGIGHTSMVYMLESQIAYIVDALQQMRARAWDAVEVRASAQATFNDTLAQQLGDTVWLSGCRSWYLDEQGRNTTLWPGFTFRFRQQTARFDAENFRVQAGMRAGAASGVGDDESPESRARPAEPTTT